MNVERRQVAADAETKPADFGYESAFKLLSSILTIAVYSYSARKLMLIFTALHGMHSRYSDGNSVCPSVCQTRAL